MLLNKNYLDDLNSVNGSEFVFLRRSELKKEL